MKEATIQPTSEAPVLEYLRKLSSVENDRDLSLFCPSFCNFLSKFVIMFFNTFLHQNETCFNIMDYSHEGDSQNSKTKCLHSLLSELMLMNTSRNSSQDACNLVEFGDFQKLQYVSHQSARGNMSNSGVYARTKEDLTPDNQCYTTKKQATDLQSSALSYSSFNPFRSCYPKR